MILTGAAFFKNLDLFVAVHRGVHKHIVKIMGIKKIRAGTGNKNSTLI